MEAPTGRRRVQRIRHEPKRRELTVAGVQRLGTHFVAVTFTGEALADFRSDSFDDHVKVFFTRDGDEPQGRDYTPRAFDTAQRELTIEFLLHGDGPGSRWAERAEPGMPLLVGGPRGSMVIPPDYDWHLLAGDASALPAIHRRVEELPSGTRATVIALVDDPADERTFCSAASLDVRWVHDTEGFLRAIEDFTLPEQEGFVWCAGELSVMKRVREVMVGAKGHPKEAARIAAYWKRGASGHHEDLA